MGYRTLWDGVSVGVILRFYLERVERLRGGVRSDKGWPVSTPSFCPRALPRRLSKNCMVPSSRQWTPAAAFP